MANLTIGTSTTSLTGIRTTNAMAFKNVTNQPLNLVFMRHRFGANAGNAFPGTQSMPTSGGVGYTHGDLRFWTFNDIDGYLERGPRTNFTQDNILTGSTEQYWDDVDDLCAQIVAGNLVTYAASAAWAFNNPKRGPITFTLLASASPTIFNDGSVSYF